MILAVDPGRDKCGLAVVDRERMVYHRQIVPTPELKSYISQLLHTFKIDRLVLGDGTTSSQLAEVITDRFNLPLSLVDEARTTMEAEQRYREENSPGLKKILGFIRWKPARPVDDYVAVILAERYLDGADETTC